MSRIERALREAGIPDAAAWTFREILRRVEPEKLESIGGLITEGARDGTIRSPERHEQ